MERNERSRADAGGIDDDEMEGEGMKWREGWSKVETSALILDGSMDGTICYCYPRRRTGSYLIQEAMALKLRGGGRLASSSSLPARAFNVQDDVREEKMTTTTTTTTTSDG